MCTKFVELLKWKGCKSSSQVLECVVSLIMQLNACHVKDRNYLNQEDGMQFTDLMIPVLLSHFNHPDWLARKAAIQGALMLIKAS